MLGRPAKLLPNEPEVNIHLIPHPFDKGIGTGGVSQGAGYVKHQVYWEGRLSVKHEEVGRASRAGVGGGVIGSNNK